MDCLSADDIIGALKCMDDCWRICSLHVDYPLVNQLTIFYVKNGGQFMQRIIKFPSGDTVDMHLLTNKDYRPRKKA